MVLLVASEHVVPEIPEQDCAKYVAHMGSRANYKPCPMRADLRWLHSTEEGREKIFEALSS